MSADDPALHLGHSDSAEQEVIDALHKHTTLCAGADTCAARGAIEPLLAERDRLQTALKEAREAIAAAHHSGSHAERRRLSQEAIHAITATLNA